MSSKFKLIAELIDLPGGREEIVDRKEEIKECANKDEAVYLARDLAWDLYQEHEDSRVSFPSFNMIEEMYRGEWYDVTQTEYEQNITDLYIQAIDSHIDYWIEEVKE